jgi:hypothetical protein
MLFFMSGQFNLAAAGVVDVAPGTVFLLESALGNLFSSQPIRTDL